jgi:predicted nucleic acid-binding protein
MVFKILLDANVILDFLLKRTAYEEARQVFSLVVNRRIQGFVTPAIVHIVSYWVTKSLGKQKAKDLLLTLLSDVTVIDCNHETAVLALHSSIEDMEDALQYYTALSHKLNFFISRDQKLQDFSIAQLPVFSPDQFLKFP